VRRVSAAAEAADAAAASAEDPKGETALLRAKRSAYEAREKMLKELRRLRGLNDDMAYTEFWELLARKKIVKVHFSEDREALRAFFVNGESARVQLPFDPALMPKLLADKVPVDAAIVDKRKWAIQGVVRGLTPIIAFYGALSLFKAAMKEPADEFMTPKAKQAAADTGITLNDVAGLGALRSEVEEIVRFLRSSSEFLEMGAQLPAGVLMVGPPGTGKTLLARAIAGEAKVPFYFAAGSEFMEMFVGVGAARVRALWEQARKTRPCIIFIDEFDAIGTARNTSGGGGGSEESANTINQLLTEMDGFEDNEGIVVLAATNRPGVLDKALTRPGRFDRWLRLPLPDLPGRVEILQVHARGKAVAADVDWVRVARACAGWSGADLENLMNQAAISCIRNGADIIDTERMFDAVDALRRDPNSGQLMLGIATVAEEEAIEELGPRTRQSIAAHAASKALMAHVLTGFDEVQKVHLFPNGEPTSNIYFLPREEALDTGLRTEAFLRSELVVRMAGRAGEAMLLGAANVSTAGKDDLYKAGYVARTLVLAMGVNETLGPVSYMDSSSGEVYLSSDMRSESDRLLRMSPPVAFRAFAECAGLVANAEAYAAYTLALNWDALRALMDALLERRVMGGPELARFLAERGVVQVSMGDFEGVIIDERGNVHFPEEGLNGRKPAVQPHRITTKASAALPGGAFCVTGARSMR
jgi:cell division protease FtsH